MEEVKLLKYLFDFYSISAYQFYLPCKTIIWQFEILKDIKLMPIYMPKETACHFRIANWYYNGVIPIQSRLSGWISSGKIIKMKQLSCL